GVDLGAVSISNSNSLAVSTVGALASDFDSLKVTGNQSALSFTVGADATLTTGVITATGNLGSVAITTGAGSYFSGSIDETGGKTIGDVTINATGTGSEASLRISGGPASIGNISFTATGDDISGYVTATTSGGSIGNLTITVTGDDVGIGYGFSAGYISGEAADIAQGNIGDITISVNGDDNSVSGGADAHHGDLGNISMTVTGDNNWVSFSGSAVQSYYYHSQSAEQDSGYYYVDGGNIGTVNVNVDGQSSANISLYISGGGSIGDVTISLDNAADLTAFIEADAGVSWIHDEPMTAGNIGNVSITMGDDTNISGGFSAAGGDIGNVSISILGDDASGSLSFYASYASGGYGWETGDSDDYFKGGNIGNVSLTIDGDGSTLGLNLYASGGDIGTVDISVNGNGASGSMTLSAQNYHPESGGTGGDIGAINITLGDLSVYEIDIHADGAVGPMTVNMGDDGAIVVDVSGGLASSMGAQTYTAGDNASISVEVSGWSGSVGTTSVTMGDNGEYSGYFAGTVGGVGAITATFGGDGEYLVTYDQIGGAIGATNVTMGAGSVFHVVSSGGATSMGKVTLTGGDSSSSAGLYVIDSASVATMGGLDASAWLGTTGVDLSGVNLGTTIRVGAAGSVVTGTEGADNIFLGAGKDTVHFDATPTASDVLFTYTVGASKDVMDVTSATTLLAVETVDAAVMAVAGDIVRLVDINDGNVLTLGDNADITTVAGLATALSTGGEYVLHDFTAANTVTVITAASATASTFYVFQITDADGGADTLAAEITLLGVVNTTAASAIGGLVLGNFM
ncbi:MAG TPA: hypothetical protein VK981_02845, partial [Ramlibacter sp.]|nr:hypothetical protein [Ramlibacter sp.]